MWERGRRRGRWGALNEAINKIIFYPAKEITAWHSTTNPSTQLPCFRATHLSLRKTHTTAPDGPLTKRGKRWESISCSSFLFFSTAANTRGQCVTVIKLPDTQMHKNREGEHKAACITEHNK